MTQLYENKNVFLVEECHNTHYQDCKIIVTVPIFLNPDMGYGSVIQNSSDPMDPFHTDSTVSVKNSNVCYYPSMLKIFKYIGLEKKLLKLYRACDINKNNCSLYIFEQFPFIEYFDVHDVWTLPNITDQMWENYKLMFNNKNSLPEQKHLKRATIILNTKLKELSLNLKTFHEKAQKHKSKKTLSNSLKQEVG